MNRVVPVTFRFPAHLAPDARTVSVVGSFNGWNSTVHPLRRIDDHGWAITVYLPPGRVVYMFCADGAMCLDPVDDGRIPNDWGSEYSVRQVTSKITATPANYVAGNTSSQHRRAHDVRPDAVTTRAR
jgi:1,4-alpha-glucan branching enzyme